MNTLLKYAVFVGMLAAPLYALYFSAGVQFRLCDLYAHCATSWGDSPICWPLLPRGPAWSLECTAFAEKLRQALCCETCLEENGPLIPCDGVEPGTAEDAAYAACLVDSRVMAPSMGCGMFDHDCWLTVTWLSCKVRLWSGEFAEEQSDAASE
jgi:hypothetical protein